MTIAVRTLWRHRTIIRTTALNDAKARYRGTVFGLLWLFIYPLLFLGVYGAVYSRIFGIRVPGFSTAEYMQIIFCGLVPFIGFSEALTAGVSAVTGNKGLIRNTLFPVELIPVKVVLTASLSLCSSMLLLIAFLWSQGNLHLAQLLIPYVMMLQIAFSIGLAWFLSALCVFLPDIAHVIGIVVLILMIVSPIAYVRSMVPANLRPFLLPNPLYYLINLYRDAGFFGVVDWEMLAIFTAITIVVFAGGWRFFNRVKVLFSDHV